MLRMETCFLSGKFGGARLACSLPCQICGVSLQSSPPALKKQGKEKKSQVPLPLSSCPSSPAAHISLARVGTPITDWAVRCGGTGFSQLL